MSLCGVIWETFQDSPGSLSGLLAAAKPDSGEDKMDLRAGGQRLDGRDAIQTKLNSPAHTQEQKIEVVYRH